MLQGSLVIVQEKAGGGLVRDVDSSVAAVAGETVRTRTTIQQRPHCPHYQGVRLFHQTRFKKIHNS